MINKKGAILIALCMLISFNLIAQSQEAFIKKKEWIDSVYQSLTIEERIGQLFMVAAYSGGKDANYSSIKPLVQQGKVGGLIYMQGNAEAQIQQTNELQTLGKLPILIGMDAEWGLGMRLTGVRDFPKQMTLGAADNPEFVEQMGLAVAEQLSAIGVHINFAPVVDINNNPQNPIINFRSFGDNKELVTRLAEAYMRGLEKGGVTAVAKHFPGHGDVSVDSHLDLPVIKKSIEELKSLELYPYQELIKKNLRGVMVAHLNVPAMDNRSKVPSTLSYPIITEWLKEDMGFMHLIFTDALNMKGVTKYYGPGEVDLKAFLAGNDILLFSQNVNKGIELIKDAYDKGEVTEERLAHSVRKILSLKYDKGLHHFKAMDATNATQKANEKIDWFLTRSSHLSTTHFKGSLIDKESEEKKVLHVMLNANSAAGITNKLKELGANVTTLSLSNANDLQQFRNVKQGNYDHIIISIHASMNYPGKARLYGVPLAQMNAIKSMMSWDNVYLGILGNPYLMQSICGFKNVIIGYENNVFSQEALVNVLFGYLPAQGKIPVTICQ